MNFTRRSPYPEFYAAYGGCMPFPPEDCPSIEYSFVDLDSGMRWLNNGICLSNKCGWESKCTRRQAYKKDNFAEWNKEAERLSAIRAERRG